MTPIFLGAFFLCLRRSKELETVKQAIERGEFYHYYQPIYNIGYWKVVGYESFLRSKSGINPEAIFMKAKSEEQLYELDSWSIHKAAETYRKAGMLKKDELLFLNVFPSTIINPSFSSFINKIMNENMLESQQVVFEISESESNYHLEKFKNAIQQLKQQGFLIAVDDLGKDGSSLKLVIEIEPDFIKLDQYFSRKLHLSKEKQMIIKFLINYAEQFNTKLILEGIETPSEIAIAKALGVTYGQGFLLGRPEQLVVR